MKGNSIIAFFVGCAVGSAVSYFVTKHFVEKKERAIAEDKVASMREYVREIREKDVNGDLVSSLLYMSKGNKDEDAAKQDYEWVQNGAAKDGVKDPYKDVDYASLYKGSKESSTSNANGNDRNAAGKMTAGNTADQNKDDNRFDPAAYEHPSDDMDEDELRQILISRRKTEEAAKRMPPKVISVEEYDDPEYDHYDKVTLYYYKDNGVLVDEDDTIIADPVIYIGDSIIKTGFDQNEEKALYVRNTSRGTDYEIGKVFGAFEYE